MLCWKPPLMHYYFLNTMPIDLSFTTATVRMSYEVSKDVPGSRHVQGSQSLLPLWETWGITGASATPIMIMPYHGQQRTCASLASWEPKRLKLKCRLKNIQWNILWNLYNALSRMCRKKKNDTLCTLRGRMIKMMTSAKSLDIWYGDYCSSHIFLGLQDPVQFGHIVLRLNCSSLYWPLLPLL